MDVILTFEELSDYVARHYGKRIDLTREGEFSIRAVYHAGLLSQSVSLRVAAIDDNCLTIAFKGGVLLSMLVKGFRGAINDKLGAGILIYKNNFLIIDLKVIPQAQAIASAIKIREITPSDTSLIIKADLK
ncbi:MAG: hypothetical protein K2K82_09110 [Muribaculaceae bacterium]|nr:hypothetical protein [Muribaculaceae bacterium]